MAVAQALAIVPGIEVVDAEPAADHDALLRLARWCHRITPLVSIDGIDSLWLDITGCAHLSGGEAALLESVLGRFARDGLQARAAVADTPGAAHALARYGAGPRVAPQVAPQVVPPGEHAAALRDLPIGALRLTPDLVTTLRRLGFEQVQHLGRIPRALLARRFGPLPGLRLDQAHGRVHEPLAPLTPATILQRRTGFLEPLLTAEALAIAITHLMLPLCEEMERSGLGARQIDLLFERVDSHVAAIRIGTARPSRDGPHLARMLAERLDTIDPGLGVEAMQVLVPLAEPLQWEQQEGTSAPQDVARLVDRLTNRLGTDRVFQANPAESDRPDRCVNASPPEKYVIPGLVPRLSGSLSAREDKELEKSTSSPDLIHDCPVRARTSSNKTSSSSGLSRGSTPLNANKPSQQACRYSNGQVMASRECHVPSSHASAIANHRNSLQPTRSVEPDSNVPDMTIHTVPHASDPASAAQTGQRNNATGHDGENATSRDPEAKPSLTLVSRRDDDTPRDPRSETHLRLIAPQNDAGREPPLLDWRPRSQNGTQQRTLPRTSAPWPTRLHAPARLLDPPRPVEALAALPDQPPVAFTWRRRRYRVRRADGPERVQGEWWRNDKAMSVRDYFQVEDDAGQRFWLFREGNGLDPRTGNLSWYLHGLF